MQEISLVPSSSSRLFWETASKTYYESLMSGEAAKPAAEYLKSRNLSKGSVQSFRLGFVGNPLAGHEHYRGKLAIPYLTRSGVVAVRFRKLPGDDDPAKYRSMPGEEPRLYNTLDLDRRESYVCICEGEFDAITAHQAGMPAVGVAGVNGWRPFFARCFKGYENVFVLCDNDDKGQGHEFGERVVTQIPGARLVLMPAGHDVNSFVCESGEQALRDLLEVE